GNIMWYGEEEPIELANLSESQFRSLRSRRIGMIFQEPLTALNPTQRIGNQLVETIRLLGIKQSKAEQRDYATHWLERVRLNDPDRMLGAYPHQLSGGQRQRVLIAMAMAAGPRLLIADEPTTALDTVTEASILELLSTLQQEQDMALLFISHDLAIVRHLSDQVIILRAGKEVESGQTKALLDHPKEDYTRSLVAASPRMQFGKKLVAAQVEDAQQKELLWVKDLSVRYPIGRNWFGRPVAYLQAVNKVSFRMAEGEFLALVGESGCGKSSLARVLCGLETAESGESSLSPPAIQLVFQDPFSSLNPSWTIGALLIEVVRQHSKVSRSKAREQAEALLEKVGLTAQEYFNRFPNELSGGQRQRVAIARALAAQPKVLICDEAVSALDANLQLGVMKLLKELTEKQRIGILFISHDLALVSTYAHRVLVMDRGKIVEMGSPQALLHNAEAEPTKRLLSAIALH
ncbi:MAG: ABC transporter ATP-binding protein, partial [Bacteroidota bacterium]